MEKKRRQRLWNDLFIIVISVIVAIYIVRSPILDYLFLVTAGHYVVSSFIAGLFFTSAFTTAPAVVVLGMLGATHPPLTVALVGGIGAVIGDLVIFSFIKGRIADDLLHFLSHIRSGGFGRLFKYRFFRGFLVLLGGIVIASPLPDELGLALMGVSRISTRKFMIISFVFNTLGILAIACAARAI